MPTDQILGRMNSHDPLLAIIISVVLASIITVYPVSYDASVWRPSAMFMVMLYWMICQPVWCGVWFAFLTGIFTDLLIDTPLGLNALSFVVTSFVILYFRQERRLSHFGNLWLVTILGLFLHFMLMWISLSLIDPDFSFMRHWPSFISSVLLWPILFISLKKWRVI